MPWEIEAARSAFPAFATEWDRLNNALYGGHPLFDSRFVLPLLEIFGDGSERLCVHRTLTNTDGALILRPFGLGHWALFLPAQAQVGAVLLADARLLETLMPALPGFVWSIDLLALDPDYCPAWNGLRVPRTVAQHALTMAVAVDGTFDDYWQSRPRHMASNVRRYQRRAREQLGALSLVTIADEHEIKDAVARYGTLEKAGWKGQAGTAVSIDNAQGQFYEKTLREFAASGQGKVLELYIGDRHAASRLIIRHDRMWVMLKTAYDESLAAFAPGRLLLYEALGQVFSETRSGTVEFYTDATRDQAEWATCLRYIEHHQLYRNELLAAVYGLAKTMRTSLAKRAPEAAEGKTRKLALGNTKTYQSIHDLSPEAIRLFQDYGRQNVEFSAEWFSNLQRNVFAGDPGVRYYVTEFDGLPSAILPLRLTRRGPIREVEALANYYTSLYSPILGSGRPALDLIPLLKLAARDHGGAHVMHFSPMDPDSTVYEALLTALRTSGWIPFRFFRFGNWFLKVEGKWAEYLKSRSGLLRSTIKRMGKKFAAEGGTLEILIDPAMVEVAIQGFQDVYALSWKQPEPYPDFVPGLIGWLAAKGELRMGIARLAGRPVAAQLWTVSHGKAHIFKVAYDEARYALSPGTLVTALLMEHVIDCDGVQKVDFLIGEDKYKQLWMTHRRERWGIVAYNPRTLIGIALLVWETAKRMLRRLLILQSSWFRRASMAPTNLARRLLKTVATNQLNGAVTIDNVSWRLFPAADFAAVAPRWQALCDATIRTPLLSADFVGTALRHFGRGDELVCIAEGPGGPVAGAILQRKNWLVWQTFQPSQMPLGPWLQKPGTDFVQVARSLLRHLPFPAMVIAATQIDPDFYCRPDGEGVMTIDSITTGRTNLAPTIEQFMGSATIKENPKPLNALLRRMRAAERDHGTITLSVETRSEAAKDYVNHYAATESRGWKGLVGTALSPNDMQANFYSELMERFAAQGAARMYTLKFGDACVARQIAVKGKSVLILLKTTFEPEFRNLGPGVIQMYRVIQDVYERDAAVKVIELYGPFNESQKLWVSGTRVIYHANVYRFGFLASLHRRWKEARKRSRSASQSTASAPE